MHHPQSDITSDTPAAQLRDTRGYSIVTNPAVYSGYFGLRRDAWSNLMAARGNRCNHVRLQRAQLDAPAITLLTGQILRPARLVRLPSMPQGFAAPQGFDGPEAA